MNATLTLEIAAKMPHVDPKRQARLKAYRASNGDTKIQLPYSTSNAEMMANTFGQGVFTYDRDTQCWYGATDLVTFGMGMRHLRYRFACLTYIAVDGDTENVIGKFSRTWTRMATTTINGVVRAEYTVR